MTSRIRKQKPDSIPFSLRLPPELHSELSSAAAATGKSLNALMVEILDRGIQPVRVLDKAREEDPLAIAYMAADIIATYVDVVRMGVLQGKMNAGDLVVGEGNAAAIANTSPGLLHPSGVSVLPDMTPAEAALLEAWRSLPDEKKHAAALLLGAKEKA